MFAFWNADSPPSEARHTLRSGMFYGGRQLSHSAVGFALLCSPPARRCLLVSHLLGPRSSARSRAGRSRGSICPPAFWGPSGGDVAPAPFARSPRSLLQCHPAPIHSRQNEPAPDPAPGATQPDGRGSKTKVPLLAECVFSGRSYFCCGCELKLSRLNSPSPRGLWNVNLFQSSVF